MYLCISLASQQLEAGKFPFPVPLEYTLADPNLPSSARTREECLYVHGKTFPRVLYRHLAESVRREVRKLQFYMKQHYRNPEDNSTGAVASMLLQRFRTHYLYKYSVRACALTLPHLKPSPSRYY